MKKALDAIMKIIAGCDCVFMLIDVRIYRTGFNYTLNKVIKEKRKQPVIILSRKDLIPKTYDVKKITNFFQNLNLPHYFIDAHNDKLDDILMPVRETKRIINKSFHGTDFKPTIIIVGSPNSGKSTYINALRLKASAATANIPGITKRVSLFSIKKLASFVDTPGILHPEVLTKEQAYPLHLVRAIKKSIIPISESVSWALEMLFVHSLKQYQELAWRFNFNDQILLKQEQIEKEFSLIMIERLYSYLSGPFPFIWDY